MAQKVIVSFLFVFFCCATALQISSKDVSFASDDLETNLYFKKDSTMSSGMSISVELIGEGAPLSVNPEDVLSVNGGKITVGSGGNTVSASSALRLPSMLMLVGFIGLVFGARNSAALSALSLALLVGSAFALQLNSGWIVNVTVLVPLNYNLDRLSISISKGSITTDSDMGTTIGDFRVDMCQGNALNRVVLDGFTFGNSAQVCATDKVWMNAVVGSNMNVQSTTDSAQVFLKSTFANAYELTCESGYALSTPCMTPTTKSLTTKHIKGNCGSSSSTITISAKHNAILAKAENTSVVGMKRWSQAATWGSQGVPKAGSDVTIAQDQVILLDTKTAALGLLDVRGTLIADPDSDFWVTADAIEVRGMLRVGWLSSPYTKTGGFTLTGLAGNYTSRAPYAGFANDGQSRGFRFFSSSIMEMHGNAPKTVYTRLNSHANQNDTKIIVDSVAGWKVGDQIAISPTTFPSTSSTDFRTIKAINSATNEVTLDKGLSFGRFGRMQYVTDNGLSFTPGTFEKMKAHPDVADTLDERAVIIHLTRNIVVEGANDTEWQNGHGVHFMWMGSMTAQLDGVEFRRSGQAGVIGRYAVHAHMQSYSMPDGMNWPALSNGVFIGDADRTFVRNIAVHESKNRAIAIHGTCGARYVNNVAGDILGHAYFFEDGSEIRNHFVGNVALNVKKPRKENQLLLPDDAASGIWISNGNNVFRDNILGDIKAGFGLWNAVGQRRTFMEYADIQVPNGITFERKDRDGESWMRAIAREKWVLTAKNDTTWSVVGDRSGQLADATAGQDYRSTKDVVGFKISGSATVGSQITFSINASGAGCLGQSKWVDLWPFYTPMYVYENNTGFACEAAGAQSDSSAKDDFGTLTSESPVSMNDSRPRSPWDSDWRVETTFNGSKLWMNAGGAYANRLINPVYKRWTVADNRGTDLNGAVQFGLVANFLFVGNSLNTLEKALYKSQRAALASYHFALAFHNLTFFNYPPLPNGTTIGDRFGVAVPGLLQSCDLYLNSIEMGPAKSQYNVPGLLNWKTFNTTEFERCPPPNIEYLYGPEHQGPDLPRVNGYQGRYWTYAGAMYDKAGVLSGQAENYIIFDHPYLSYNLTNKRTLGRPGISKTLATSDKHYGMQLTKNDDNNDYAGQIWYRLDNKYQPVANWTIKDGKDSWLLGYMRHAGAVKGGKYRLEMENGKVWSQKVEIAVTNADALGENFIIGFPWNCAVTPKINYAWKDLNSTLLVNSMSELESKAPSYMLDAANNLIWVHHKSVEDFPINSISGLRISAYL